MGLFPCSVGLHRYSGSQQTAYMGWVNGARSERGKLRLCSDHFKALKFWLDDTCQLAAIGETTQIEDGGTPPVCCDKYNVDTHHTVYANLYGRGDEARAYWGLKCDDHALEFARMAQIEV